MRLISIFAVAACLASVSHADGWRDSVGKAIDKGAEIVGKGVDAIGTTMETTSELMRDEETPAATRAKLDVMEADVMARLLSQSTDAQATFDQSAGYAAFDMRQVTIFPLSGGYGRGVAVSPDGATRVYMQMGTGGVGAAFGIGGFASQFVIMFETDIDFERFIENGYDAAADAGLQEGQDLSKESVRFINGQSYFVLDKNAWRVNANATGTRYWPDRDLN
ncbi:MAG: hypothetical protein AB8B58_00845 [Roseobacter sp.]